MASIGSALVYTLINRDTSLGFTDDLKISLETDKFGFLLYKLVTTNSTNPAPRYDLNCTIRVTDELGGFIDNDF